MRNVPFLAAPASVLALLAGCAQHSSDNSGGTGGPAIVGISTTNADGTYGLGEWITVIVTWSQAVTADLSGGTPKIELNSGGIACYVGGSGTNAWTFRYQVGPGDASPDLDHDAIGSWNWNGASGSSGAGSPDTGLPAPGGTGSIAVDHAITVSTTPIGTPFLSGGASWRTFDPDRAGVGAAPAGYADAAYDGRYLYFAPDERTGGKHGEVLRHDTQSALADTSSWTAFDPGANGVGAHADGYTGALFDGRYVWFCPGDDGAPHGEVLRYDPQGTFTDAGSWAAYDPGVNGVGNDADGYSGLAFDGRYLYFAPLHNGTAWHGEVLRHDTQGAFATAASWTTFTPVAHGVGTIGAGFTDVVIAAGHAWFVPGRSAAGFHGEVLRYDLAGAFDQAASWSAFAPTAGLVHEGYSGAAFDGRYLYFVPDESDGGVHGEVLRCDTTGAFAAAGSWTAFDPGLNGVGATARGFADAAFDGRYLYFAPRDHGAGAFDEVLRHDTQAAFDQPASWAVFDPDGDNLGWTDGSYSAAVLAAGGIWFVPVGLTGDFHGEVLRFGPPASGLRVYGQPQRGTLHVGQPIRFKVQFGEVAVVDVSSGTPYVALSHGVRAFYRGGSGTSNLEFLYIPMAHESALDLTYAATTSLLTNGATIRNVGAVDLDLTLPSPTASASLAAHNAIVVATTPVALDFSAANTWDTFDYEGTGVASVGAGYQGVVFDGEMLYLTPQAQTAPDQCEFVRYTPAEGFTVPSSWDQYDPGRSGLAAAGNYRGGVYDGRYVYFAPHAATADGGQVLRYDTRGDWSTLASWTVFDKSTFGLGDAARGYSGAIFDGRYVYFAPAVNAGGAHGGVLRYDTLQDFATVTSWEVFDAGANAVGVDPDGYVDVVTDRRYLYFVPAHNGTARHGEVLRYDTQAAFAAAGSWAAYDPGTAGLGAGLAGFGGAVFDGQHVYFAPDENAGGRNGTVMRYDTSATFSVLGSWSAFDPGANGVGTDADGYLGATFDGRYLYFAPSHNGTAFHGEVLRFDTQAAFGVGGSWTAFDPGGAGVGAGLDGYDGVLFDGSYVLFIPAQDGGGIHGRMLVFGK